MVEEDLKVVVIVVIDDCEVLGLENCGIRKKIGSWSNDVGGSDSKGGRGFDDCGSGGDGDWQ